jgi:hypothetical protein
MRSPVVMGSGISPVPPLKEMNGQGTKFSTSESLAHEVERKEGWRQKAAQRAQVTADIQDVVSEITREFKVQENEC